MLTTEKCPCTVPLLFEAVRRVVRALKNSSLYISSMLALCRRSAVLEQQ